MIEEAGPTKDLSGSSHGLKLYTSLVTITAVNIVGYRLVIVKVAININRVTIAVRKELLHL